MSVFCLDCRTITATGPRCPSCSRTRNRKRDAASPYRNARWQKLRARLTRQAGACTICGSHQRLTVHHLHGRKRDITQGPFAVLCGHCHSTYEAERRAGRRTDLTRLIDRIATLSGRPGF